MLAAVVGLVVGSIVVVKWSTGGGDPASADAGTSPMQDARGEASLVGHAPPKSTPGQPKDASPPAGRQAPGPQPNAPAQPPKSEPVKISMGGNLPAVPAAGGTRQTPTRSGSAGGAGAGGGGGGLPLANPPPARSEANAAPAPSTSTSTRTDRPASANPASSTASAPSNASVAQRIQLGLDLVKLNKPVEARRTLTDALLASGISHDDARRVRDELTRLNQRLVFSPEAAAGDVYASVYQIQSGDSLAKLPRKLGLSVDWRFLQRINHISDPARIQVNQRIKVIKGPFHAIIDKRAFRMDVYLGDGSDRVYVRSFPVGLGEYGATPEGAFTVRPNSKLINPAWVNPRTHEAFEANDPKNPLGEYWIGLVGISENIRGLETYGIHGTIEPESIGQERSMGCVRLLHDDVALVYELLIDNVSRVEIHGLDWP